MGQRRRGPTFRPSAGGHFDEEPNRSEIYYYKRGAKEQSDEATFVDGKEVVVKKGSQAHSSQFAAPKAK